MRIVKALAFTALCALLVGCATSLIVGNQVERQLMGALLKPLVGFDPNDVDLFEIPLVKNRMTTLLGENYEPTMTLLRTAQSIQKEGALYYVASRYAPSEVKQLADQAAMVWNADTNQMAVMLIHNDLPAVYAEKVADIKQAVLPPLPSELQARYDQAIAIKDALEEKQQGVLGLKSTVTGALEARRDQLIDDTAKKAANTLLEATGNKQSDLSAAKTAQ